MKKVLSLVLLVAMVLTLLVGCAKTPAANSPTVVDSTPPVATPEVKEKPSIGFILLGLGSEFFQNFADTFVEVFTEEGWDASATDGKFDVTVQIEAIENYTAMGVDVLIVFPSEGPPVDDALKKAQEAGVKVIEMVNCGENWDVSMISVDEYMAEYLNMVAALWVEETFPDAEDGSIECVALTYFANEVNKRQANVALEIEKYSSKIKLVHEYQLTEETTEAGMSAAENILTSYPNVNLIISPQGTVMVGVNNYLTSMNSPITDYSEIGLFACNASGQDAYDAIAASGEDKAPLRGSIMTGAVLRNVYVQLELATGLLDGSVPSGFISYAPYELVRADTVEEFLRDSKITSFTTEDIKGLIPYFYIDK